VFSNVKVGSYSHLDSVWSVSTIRQTSPCVVSAIPSIAGCQMSLEPRSGSVNQRTAYTMKQLVTDAKRSGQRSYKQCLLCVSSFR